MKDFGRVQMEVCAKCGGLVREVNPFQVAQQTGDRKGAARLLGPAFWARPFEMLAFPFSSWSGPIAIVFFAGMQTVVLGFGRYALARVLLALILFHGLLLGYAGWVARRVDLGDDRMPAPEDFGHIWDDIYAPAVRFVIALWPMIGAAFLAQILGDDMPVADGIFAKPGPLALFIGGVLVLPGAILQAVSEGTIGQIVNPVGHVRVLLAEPRAYLAALAYTAVLIAAYVLIRRPLVAPTFTFEAIDGALHTYFMLVLARLYGLFLRSLH
jgi:hypothetical protein